VTAPTVQAIMEAVQDRLETVVGLRSDPFLPDQVNPPHAVVSVPPIENYRTTFRRGRFELRFSVYVLVSATLDRIGQMAMASYADVTGDNSIPLAIEGDRTLGGVVDDCVVVAFRPMTQEEVGQISYYGGVFDLLVIARGQ